MREKTRYPQVYKRGYGSYSYRAYDENGKPFEKSGFKTAGEARDARLKALVEIKEGRFIRTPLTVLKLCQRYLEYKKARLRPGSYTNVRISLEKWVIPEIGHIKLDKLRVEHIDKLIENVKEKRGPKRANGILSHFNLVASWGMKRRFLEYNPGKAVDKFKVNSREKVILTDEEIEKLLAVALPRDRTIISIGLYAGLRRSEIFALDKEDLDFAKNTIHVRYQLLQGKKEEPKTISSKREVPIIQPLREALEEYAEEVSIFGCLFPSAKGGRLHSEEWSYSTFTDLVKKTGIRECVFNDTRHTFGTKCAVSGVPVEMLAKIMGHSSIQTTYKYYYAPTIQDKIKGIEPFEKSDSSKIVARVSV